MRGFKLYRKVGEQIAGIRQRVAGVTRPVGMLDTTQNAGLVKVTLWFINHSDSPDRFSPTEHIVAEGDAEAFVTASQELHGGDGGRAAPVQYITTQSLRPRGPFWWSTPGLGDNGDPSGAVIWDWGQMQRVWIRPGVNIDMDDPEYAS